MKKMKKNTFKIKGFVVKKNIFKNSELSNFERNLIEFICKLTFKSHKKISNKAKSILNYKSNKFRLASIKLLEDIEIKDKSLFYKISKFCSNICSIDQIDQNKKIQLVLKNYFGRSFNSIQRMKPIILFNKKNLDRLKYMWHQESQFYPNHNLGLHLWFPIFRSVKSKDDGGMLFAANGYKKNYKFTEIKLKNSWTQRVPKINVEKNFQILSPNVKRGDAIFFIGNQLHKSDNQLNSIPRVSLVIRYLSSTNNKVCELLS
tara:strand:+ start:1135 stop:1914 length:780 start_codon:yes stop_codon:yes gene_type:complete